MSGPMQMGGSLSHPSDQAPLIGEPGMTYVATTLSSERPQVAIRKIQARTSLSNPLCAPLLGMIDKLGLTRAEAHRSVLTMAKQALLSKITCKDPEPDPAQLEALLNASFNYLGIPELREVPLSIMNTLDKVPTMFLKQLTEDHQIFRELPAKVQRQVWEFDRALLQQDAMSPVGIYKYETATIMRAMHMDEFLPPLILMDEPQPPPNQDAPPSAAAGPGRTLGRLGKRPLGLPLTLTPVTRKILRKGSRVLNMLKSMVGVSHKIYTQIIELCVVKYRDSESPYVGSKELSYCTLRSQLLMALHDDASSVANKDRCHDLAWTLDAGITNGHLTERHLSKLVSYFDDVQSIEKKRLENDVRQARAAAEAASRVKRKGQGLVDVREEAESAGNIAAGYSLDEPNKVLGDASLILRDPSAMHLLLATLLHQALKGALTAGQLETEGVPSVSSSLTGKEGLGKSDAGGGPSSGREGRRTHTSSTSSTLGPQAPPGQGGELVVSKGKLPKDLPLVPFLTSILRLAIEGRGMMRERKYHMPPPDPRVLNDLLPLLCSLAIDHEIKPSPPPSALPPPPSLPPPDPNAPPEDPSKPQKSHVYVFEEGMDKGASKKGLEAMSKSELARRLAQTFVLERLYREDYLSAARVMRMLAQATTSKAIPELFDFGSSLAQRLSDLIQAKKLTPSSPLWVYSVDNLLVRAVDSHVQTHEEVLRLLLLAAPLMPPTQLGAYLALTLENSKKSRRRSKKRLPLITRDPLADFPMSLTGDGLGGGSDTYGSDGWPGVLALKNKGNDAVRSVYNLFVHVKGVDATTAPALFEYLDEDRLAEEERRRKAEEEEEERRRKEEDDEYQGYQGGGEENGEEREPQDPPYSQPYSQPDKGLSGEGDPDEPVDDEAAMEEVGDEAVVAQDEGEKEEAQMEYQDQDYAGTPVSQSDQGQQDEAPAGEGEVLNQEGEVRMDRDEREEEQAWEEPGEGLEAEPGLPMQGDEEMEMQVQEGQLEDAIDRDPNEDLDMVDDSATAADHMTH